jgi:2-keto-3-deoxy-L-fuconate dehydrogenase
MGTDRGRVAGKTAVVTAAGQGIGREIALALAREGAVVHAADINEAALKALDAESAAVHVHVVDVTDIAAIAAFVAEVPSPGVLINGAGTVHHGTILDCDEPAWDFSFELNVTSAYRMLKAFLPGMLENGGGSIINIASVVSSLKGAPNRFAYGTTKGALLGLTKSIAMDFIGDGIRCNAICPGTVETPSLQERMNAFDDPEAARRDFVARQPMGRLGAPEEIAALALYLASDESAYTTGIAHVIDGGWTI